MGKVAIIGSGPAGYTAAIYTGRANLAPVIFTGEETGGQLMTTTEVENYPGFPEGVRGPELMAKFEDQATRFGAEMRSFCVVKAVERTAQGTYTVHWTDLMDRGAEKSEEFEAVIVATGATARHLGIDGEKDFFDGSGTKAGVTACATCDGALPLYRNKPVAVIGGGDTACEEATFMTRFASKVYIVHRRDQLRASKIMADRVRENPKIEFLWNKTVTEYKTNEKNELCAVQLLDTVTGESSEMALNGVFLAIGHVPNTGFLKASGVTLDAAGYIDVQHGCRTNLEGLFAAGDVRDSVYRQAITASGMGCMAAIECERYLEAKHSSL